MKKVVQVGNGTAWWVWRALFLFAFSSFILLTFSVCTAAAAPGDAYVFGADSAVTTTHPASQQTPAISGNIAVWEDSRPNAQGDNTDRIFYKQLPDAAAPSDQQTPAEQPLVENSYYQGSPAISGNLVAWQQMVVPPSGGNGWQIFYKYIGGPGPYVLSGGTYGQYKPAVAGSRIVWQTAPGTSNWNSQVHMVDLNDGVDIQITSGPGNNEQPAMDGDWAVWVHQDKWLLLGPTVRELYAKNVVTGELRQIANEGCESPAISGSKIVWVGGNARSLYFYDLATGQTRLIPHSDYTSTAKIEGNLVVWQQYLTKQIFMHDLDSGITQQVSHGTGAYLGGPALSAGHIIWQDDRDGTRAIYQNRIGDTAQALAEKYAPHLYLHHEEYFQPRKVDIMTAGEGTQLRARNGTSWDNLILEWPNLTLDSLGQYNSADDQPSHEYGGKYVDLPGSFIWGSLHSDYVDRYNSLTSTNNYPETTYAHIVRNPASGETAIQYWLPYYFDNWDNYHEGDWEHVDVILNGNLDPVDAAYSQHDTGQRRPWDYVEGPDGHPIVYVARGSHANYFYPGSHDAPFWFTDDTEAHELHQPSVTVLPDVSSLDLASLAGGPYYWLAYQGAWGELTSLPEGDGPQGPAATPEHNSVWDDPFSWFNGLCWDGSDSCDEEPRGVSGSVHSPVDIHLYDAEGRHVGKNDAGGIDKQIPGAEYIEIPDLHEKTITVHGGDAAAGYRFVLKGTGTSTFDFTLKSPDRAHNSADTVKHLAVPVTTSTEASVLLDENKDYALRIDNDGDGTVDEQRQPDSVVTQAVDLTPPAKVTDLSIANTTSGTATLMFTAPGDDGNAGIAQYYDIRYSTAPISEDNWKEAMPVEQMPVPQEAGSTETAMATGLDAGTTYYFALEARDETLQSSEISNIASATTAIPSLAWSMQKVYWASFADYQDQQLAVDYKMANTGTGIAIGATVMASLCNPSSVYVTTSLPLTVSDLNPGTSSSVTLKYYVPTNISRFITKTYTTCSDDAGRVYWFPGAMP